jgi:uncharacterized protein with FMN-binding domain
LYIVKNLKDKTIIMTNNNDLKIGDNVTATVTKKGYWSGSYTGVVVGFTANGKVKVKSWQGIKCHALHNVKKSS